MLNILKRIFIGVAIALIVFFIKDKCFAATTISAYQYRTKYLPCTEHTVLDQTICVVSGAETTSGLTSFGTGTSGPKFLTGSTVQVVTNADTSQQFIQGQYCTFTWTTNFNPKTSNAILSYPEANIIFKYWNGSEYVDFDDGQARCSNDPNSNYGMKCAASWTVPTTSRYLNIQFDYPKEISRLSNEGINFRDGKVSCTTDATVEAIGTQTGILSGVITDGVGATVDKLNEIKDQIQALLQNLFDTTESAIMTDSSKPWFASGLEYAQNFRGDINNNLFNADLQSWNGPFSLIWSIATDYINLDPIFLASITFILTISLAALVVGRI